MGYERDDRDGRYDRGYRRDDPRDRGFFERAGDEVRSWFGDDEAEHRRRQDERYDDRADRERYAGDERGAGARPDWYRSNQDEGRRDAYREGGYGRPGERGGPSYGAAARGYRDGGADRYADDWQRGYNRDDVRNPNGARDRDRDEHGYANWRDRQMSAFDRDYDEYRRENQSRFETEFAAWRQNRQTQRDSLATVQEHQEVIGSDGVHVGTVDHVRSDHILLTKTDRDAGGHHHAIPSSWIASVGEQVRLSKTADEAKRAWRDAGGQGGEERGGRGRLDRSFSGTY